MAEDFDCEVFDLLEAPYKKDDDVQPTLYSPEHQVNGAKDRNNAKRKDLHRNSRSKSKERRNSSRTGERDEASVERNNGKHNEKDRYRDDEDRIERRRSKDRGDRRIRDPDVKKRSRSRERVVKKRSKSRDRDIKKRRSRSRDKQRGKSPDVRRRSRSREKPRGRTPDVRRRSRSRDKPRGRTPDVRRRSRSRDKQRGRSPNDRRRSRSRDKRYNDIKDNRSKVTKPIIPPSRRRTPSPRPFRRGRTPPNGLGHHSPPKDLSAEERDARTVFCMQLSQRIRARDLEEFFSSVGKVRDVRLITCNKTKRFKGIAYIEFKDPESVPLALGLSGQRLLGVPISVQHTQAEKNRMANIVTPPPPPKNPVGPMRLYVGSLHFNITEDMLRGIFEPFGKIDTIQLIMDTETNRSKGYGFITYHSSDDAKKALEQLNGFELAGRPMKVGNVTERLDMNTNASLDTDEMDRSGIDLGATGRLQLMFKLAEGAGLAVPQATANALMASAPQPPTLPPTITPPIATQCFLLSNMFDPLTETNLDWEIEIQDDVIEECNKHGGALHVFVDKGSPQGTVYVKCPSIATAVLAVNSLHGRWFAGRMITAAYVPLVNYHGLFMDAIVASTLLKLTRSQN